jgi:D-3-phosphoglycerate dehydrogenase / 2-oxoglutarate reductase
VVVLRSGAHLDHDLLNHAVSLEVVVRAGVGIDNIDVAAARRKGVRVFHIPCESARSVAELTLGLMLSVARKIPAADMQLRRHVWAKHAMVGTELRSKTIGIVGLGSIGGEVATIARDGFGMKVIGCVRRRTRKRVERMKNHGICLTTVGETLRRSDFVCLCLPLSAETHSLISLEQLSMMKRTAFLVDVSRASIVNHTDLARALREKLIAGAAIDTCSERGDTAPLSTLENVVLTPHIGAMTQEAQQRIGCEVVTTIIKTLEDARWHPSHRIA